MKKQKKQDWSKIASIFIGLITILINPSCSPSTQVINLALFQFSYTGKSNIKCFKESDFEGFCVFDNVDTSFYQIGYNIYNLTELMPEMVILLDASDEEIKSIQEKNQDNKIFSNDRNFDMDKVRRQNTSFIHKGSEVWKYSIPIDSANKGLVGLYVDSLVNTEKGVIKFNFYFNQLKSMSYSEGELIIKSLTIDKRKVEEMDFYRSNILE